MLHKNATTFTNLYSTTSADPFRGDYARIYCEYAVSATGRLERVVAAPEFLQCFFLLIEDGVHPRQVVNVHDLSYFAARKGQGASVWEGNFFGFEGDLFTGGTNPPLLVGATTRPGSGSYCHTVVKKFLSLVDGRAVAVTGEMGTISPEQSSKCQRIRKD